MNYSILYLVSSRVFLFKNWIKFTVVPRVGHEKVALQKNVTMSFNLLLKWNLVQKLLAWVSYSMAVDCNAESRKFPQVSYVWVILPTRKLLKQFSYWLIFFNSWRNIQLNLNWYPGPCQWNHNTIISTFTEDNHTGYQLGCSLLRCQ